MLVSMSMNKLRIFQINIWIFLTNSLIPKQTTRKYQPAQNLPRIFGFTISVTVPKILLFETQMNRQYLILVKKYAL